MEIVNNHKIKDGSRIIIGKGHALTITVDQHFNWFQKFMINLCFGLVVEDYSEV